VVVDKREPNGFTDTELGSLLANTDDVVIVGMQSEFCVRETALAALAQGLSVTLVRGAHGTFDHEERTATEIAAAIEAELAQAGTRILDADSVTF